MMFFRLHKESCKDLKDKKIYPLCNEIENGFNKFWDVRNLKDLQKIIWIKQNCDENNLKYVVI
jgi:hypothetical protein